MMSTHSNIVVKSRKAGDVIVFDIMSGNTADSVLCQTCRYSELAMFYEALMKEKPGFQGSFPRKTIIRNTSAAFIEGRRKQIQTFLRAVAQEAADTLAYKSFLGTSFQNAHSSAANASSIVGESLVADVDNSENVPLSAATIVGETVLVDVPLSPSRGLAMAMWGRSELTETVDVAESEDESELLTGSLYDEISTTLTGKKSSVTAALATKDDLESSLETKAGSVGHDKAAAQSAAACAAEAAERLNTHLVNLEHLEAEVEEQKAARRKKEAEQMVVAKRLGEDFAVASKSTTTARKRLEQTQENFFEADSAQRLRLDELQEDVHAADVQRIAAKEHRAVVSVALSAMRESARSVMAASAAAEREQDAIVEDVRNLMEEEARAAAAKTIAQDRAHAARVAAAVHAEDAARRSKEHAVEMRRVEERLELSKALTDMQSRCLAQGEDGKILGEFGDAARKALQAANAALSSAARRSEETERVDKTQTAELAASLEKANKDLNARTSVLIAVQSRVAVSKASQRNAEAKHVAATAAAEEVSLEVGALQERLEKQFACVMSEHEHEGAWTQAKAVADAAKAERDAQLISFRHLEEAEALVLKRNVEKEISLATALDEAHLLASEAHGDVDDSAESRVWEDVEGLVIQAKARHADLVLSAKTAASSLSATKRELDGVRREIREIDESRRECIREDAWSIDHTYDLGDSTTTFDGLAVLLEGCDSLVEAIEMLREDDGTVPYEILDQGWCVMFHEEHQTHYLIFRSDRRDEVEETFGFTMDEATWTTSNTHDLGADASTFNGRAVHLKTFSNVADALEELRCSDSSIPSRVFEDGWCVVYDAVGALYYLLYRGDMGAKARVEFGFCPEESGEQGLEDAVLQRQARVTELEDVVKMQESESADAVVAVKAAKAELDALEDRRTKTVLPTSLFENLICSERQRVVAAIERHRSTEESTLQQMEQRLAAWEEEREVLNASLHAASLRCAVAEADLVAARSLKRNLRTS
eukprot:TRINITY_DN62111_c0_g1_i1.p1 TRINITY_DN62111_c0_g1~~TRINITY_DN62111_c0_g1_i1.p1  ORF type:complete len:999 (-),score=228.09 TRINITY_DN62111_c0_g1_i1:163-3159(-)